MSDVAQKGYKIEDGIKEEAKKANMRTALLQRATLTGLSTAADNSTARIREIVECQPGSQDRILALEKDWHRDGQVTKHHEGRYM